MEQTLKHLQLKHLQLKHLAPIIHLSFMPGRAATSKEMLLHLGRIQLLHLIKIDTLTDGEGSALFFQKLLFGLLQTQRSTPDPFA